MKRRLTSISTTMSSWPNPFFTARSRKTRTREERRREEVPLTAQPTGYDTTHGDGCYRAYVPPEGER